MTAIHNRAGRRGDAASGVARWLGLAAAPSFAAMALAAAIVAADPAGAPCMTAPNASPLTGMTAMYLLMSLFHLAPWVRLIGGNERMAPGAP